MRALKTKYSIEVSTWLPGDKIPDKSNVLIIRHGKREDHDFPKKLVFAKLSDDGKEEIINLRKKYFTEVHFDVIASEFERCIQTAMLISHVSEKDIKTTQIFIPDGEIIGRELWKGGWKFDPDIFEEKRKWVFEIFAKLQVDLINVDMFFS